jgi:Xaa-Pro aminopeptidase
MVLKENMILTVEPGIYLPGFGGVRIEDDVLLKKDGMELLTKSPRGFTELE